MTDKVFTLTSGNTGNLSVSTTSASVDISALVTRSCDTLRINSSVDCYVRLTAGSSTAVTTDLLVSAGSPEPFSINPDVTHLSAVTATGSGTLNWAVSKGP